MKALTKALIKEFRSFIKAIIELMVILIIIAVMLFLGFIVWHWFYGKDEMPEKNFFHELDKRLVAGETRIPIAELAPFEWEFVCTVSAYENEPIQVITGRIDGASISEDYQAVVFINKRKIIYEIAWDPDTRGLIESIGCGERGHASLEKLHQTMQPYYKKNIKKLQNKSNPWDPINFYLPRCGYKEKCYRLTKE